MSPLPRSVDSEPLKQSWILHSVVALNVSDKFWINFTRKKKRTNEQRQHRVYWIRPHGHETVLVKSPFIGFSQIENRNQMWNYDLWVFEESNYATDLGLMKIYVQYVWLYVFSLMDRSCTALEMHRVRVDGAEQIWDNADAASVNPGLGFSWKMDGWMAFMNGTKTVNSFLTLFLKSVCSQWLKHRWKNTYCLHNMRDGNM